MAAVTYGALIDAAERHLASAERSRTGNVYYPDMLAELHRLTITVARQLTIVTSADAIMADAEPAWRRAAIDLREALHLASDDIAVAVQGAENGSANRRSHTVKRISDTADCLSAAHDLIRTHITTTPGQGPADLSIWAHLTTAEPVAIAMTSEARRWADRIASWLAWIQANDGDLAQVTQAKLTRAGEWLRVPAASVGERDTPAAGQELLRGFPLATPPDRIAPEGAESVTQLRGGIERTADRLRAAAFSLPREALSPVHASGPAWLRTSWAAAIVSDIVGRVLRQVAHQPRARKFELGQIADAFDSACAAWRQAVSMWQLITTDTQARSTPLSVEADDLMLRMGRLAYADSAWTPKTSRNATLKPAAELTPGSAGLAATVGSLHQAADALAAMARADLAAIAASGRAGRLYMPNIVLWDERVRELNYAPAPPDRIALLCDVYRVILNASAQALEKLDALALSVSAPSRILASARQASPRQPATDTFDLATLKPRLEYFARPRRQPVPAADDLCGDTQADSAPPPPQQPGENPRSTRETELRCGPVESRMRAAQITDQATLLRAAAIDRAGDQLFNNAAKLAAQDTPAKPAPMIARQMSPRSSRQEAKGRSRQP